MRRYVPLISDMRDTCSCIVNNFLSYFIVPFNLVSMYIGVLVCHYSNSIVIAIINEIRNYYTLCNSKYSQRNLNAGDFHNEYDDIHYM